MAATVHGASRYGMADDSTATGLLLGDLSYSYSADITYAKNHIGCDVSVAFSNDSTEVSCSGVIAVKATGLVPDLAAAITFANDAVDTIAPKSKNLFSTPVANAGTLVSSASMKRMNADFETGDVGAIFKPLIATNSPTVLT